MTAGSVDLIGTYWQAPPGGGNSVDLAGNSEGTIAQTISTVAGQSYQLSFALSGNPDGGPTVKVLQVGFGASTATFNYDRSVYNNDKGNMMFVLDTANFVATGSSTTLSFSDIGGAPGYYGAVIGNVAVTAVPEPTTLIAGLGALGLALAGMRRSLITRIGK